MAYIPHFKHDVFISYAHDNNLPLVEGEEGWVTRFHQALETQLRQLLEKPEGLNIWRDRKLAGNDTVDDSIRDAVRSSAVLVSIFSHRYIGSAWCQEELTLFCATAGNDLQRGNKSRLCKVLLSDVPLERQPVAAQKTLGYQFFEKDPETQIEKLFPRRQADDTDQRYWHKVQEIARSIKEFLDLLKGEMPNSATPPVEKGSPMRNRVSPSSSPGQPLRVVLVYKRGVQPDEQVLKLLESQLIADGCEVVIDRHGTIDMEWAKDIGQRLNNVDVVIPLLSAASVQSEMLAYEVILAREAAQRGSGKPRLLPVRVHFNDKLPEELGRPLDPLEFVAWNGPQDNQQLLMKLLQSVRAPTTKPTSSVNEFPLPDGPIPLKSQFYVERPTDEEFYAALARRDSVVLVKGARQMGKTSLLARGLQQVREAGVRVILTDFLKLNASQLESAETFYQTLCYIIARQLRLEVMPEAVWNPHIGPNDNFEDYMHYEVLDKLSTPLVWGLDEMDRLFTCPFASEVFGLLRAWHNERVTNPSSPWQQLTLAIAHATEPHLFISNLNQSPFNVGTRLTLRDFTFEEVDRLNHMYGAPLQNEAEVARLFRLVGGQPHLVHRSLYELAKRNLDFTALERQVTRDDDEGLFGDHLRRILVSLARDPELCDVVRDVLRGRPCTDQKSFYRLRSGGVLLGDTAREARLRCQAYATFLERYLL